MHVKVVVVHSHRMLNLIKNTIIANLYESWDIKFLLYWLSVMAIYTRFFLPQVDQWTPEKLLHMLLVIIMHNYTPLVFP